MNPIADATGLERWISSVGWALILFLIQGFLVGLGVAPPLWASRGASAGRRCAVGLAGLVVMAAFPVATTIKGLTARPIDAASPAPGASAPRSRPAVVERPIEPAERPTRVEPEVVGSAANGEPIRATAAAPSPAVIPGVDWRTWIEARLPAIVTVWLLGVVALAIRFMLGFVELRRLTRVGIEPPPAEISALIDRLAGRLGWRRPVRCFLSRRVEAPSVVGWLRPTILIPAASLATLTARRMEAVLAHELAHIRRRDFPINALQVVVESAYFFHPAVWWVSRRVRVERERHCDDIAAELCGGDRLLVARALFTLEELRSASKRLNVAAAGGSLRDRVRRLVSPAPANPRTGAVGWLASGFLVAAAFVLAVEWRPTVSQARIQAENAPAASGIRGRVLDADGKPVKGARVRLHHRERRWDRVNRLVAETEAGPDGAFRFDVPKEPAPSGRSPDFPRRALVADHPGHAVGWLLVPDDRISFQEDVVLGRPIERTMRVVDEDGRPLEGAMVAVHSLGDPSSASPELREPLELRAETGPLAARTDADGRAVFSRLPRTSLGFVATKPGFAEAFAFREENSTIRLQPAASLVGAATAPDGTPLAGVTVVLHPDFIWSFHRATTDDRGRYRVDGLRARGWDMSHWGRGKTANGMYNVWIESDRFAAPTRTVTLEPGKERTLDLQAQTAGALRVTLVEAGTNRPVAAARIWGFSGETGGGSRFDAWTDERGRATFHSTPTRIHLSVARIPDGAFVVGNLDGHAGAHGVFDFQGGEQEATLTIPRIAGRLVAISGVCLDPDGSPIANATVHVGWDPSLTLGDYGRRQSRRTDRAGRFDFKGVPERREVGLYAESDDGRLAGAASVTPRGGSSEVRLSMSPLFRVSTKVDDDLGRVMTFRQFTVAPKVGTSTFPLLSRTVGSDKEGRIELDRILPGLAYHVREEPPSERAAGGGFLRRPPDIDRDVVLAPK